MCTALISSRQRKTACTGRLNGGLRITLDSAHRDGPAVMPIAGESCRTICTRTTAGQQAGRESLARALSTSSILACVTIQKDSFLELAWLKLCRERHSITPHLNSSRTTITLARFLGTAAARASPEHLPISI